MLITLTNTDTQSPAQTRTQANLAVRADAVLESRRDGHAAEAHLLLVGVPPRLVVRVRVVVGRCPRRVQDGHDLEQLAQPHRHLRDELAREAGYSRGGQQRDQPQGCRDDFGHLLLLHNINIYVRQRTTSVEQHCNLTFSNSRPRKASTQSLYCCRMRLPSATILRCGSCSCRRYRPCRYLHRQLR